MAYSPVYNFQFKVHLTQFYVNCNNIQCKVISSYLLCHAMLYIILLSPVLMIGDCHANEHLKHADQINNQVIKVKKCGEGNNLVWLINCVHVTLKWVYQGEEP